MVLAGTVLQSVLELIMGGQPLAGGRWGSRRSIGAPLVFMAHYGRCGKLFERGENLRLQACDLALLLPRWQRNERLRIPVAIHRIGLGNAVEVSRRAIEVLLLQRIVLVIMTAGTTDCQPKPDSSRGTHAV